MSNRTFYFDKPISETELITTARNAISERLFDAPIFTSPHAVRDYLMLEMADKPHEVFYVLFLTNKHKLIAIEPMFQGTIDGASIYPREVVRRVMHHNAAAVILAHNHPSGCSEPSRDDLSITTRLKEALALIDVRILDHLVVGLGEITSFAERGML
mgnify:CR=1 FL=1